MLTEGHHARLFCGPHPSPAVGPKPAQPPRMGLHPTSGRLKITEQASLFFNILLMLPCSIVDLKYDCCQCTAACFRQDISMECICCFLNSFAMKIIAEGQERCWASGPWGLSISHAVFCVYEEGRKEIILVEYLLETNISVYRSQIEISMCMQKERRKEADNPYGLLITDTDLCLC